MWWPGLVCFNTCEGAIKTWSLMNFMSEISIRWSVWHLCAESSRNDMHNLHDNWSKVSWSGIDSRYFNTVPTSHVCVNLGNAGRVLKTPFINLEISSNLFMSRLLHILRNTLKADRAMPIDLYFNPWSNKWERNFKIMPTLGRRGSSFSPQNLIHLAIYPLYWTLVDFRQDCRMRSVACLGMPFFRRLSRI